MNTVKNTGWRKMVFEAVELAVAGEFVSFLSDYFFFNI